MNTVLICVLLLSKVENASDDLFLLQTKVHLCICFFEVYPDRCKICFAALGNSERVQRKLGFWDNVYGEELCGANGRKYWLKRERLVWCALSYLLRAIYAISAILNVFRDVTQRSPERGALRDIPKDGCEGDYIGKDCIILLATEALCLVRSELLQRSRCQWCIVVLGNLTYHRLYYCSVWRSLWCVVLFMLH